jgi:hypothetical protein
MTGEVRKPSSVDHLAGNRYIDRLANEVKKTKADPPATMRMIGFFIDED